MNKIYREWTYLKIGYFLALGREDRANEVLCKYVESIVRRMLKEEASVV